MSGQDRANETSDIIYQSLSQQFSKQSKEISENRKQAALFLRLTIGTLGLIVALTKPLDTVSVASKYIQNADPQQAVNILAGDSGGLFHFVSEVTIVIMILVIWTFGSFSIYQLFIQLPISAFNASRPTPVKLGTNTLQQETLFSINESTIRRRIIQDYQDAIQENQRVLNKTVSELDNCFLSAKRGILSGIGAISAFFALSQSDVIIISFAFMVSLTMVGFAINWNEHLEKIESIPIFDWTTDIPLIIGGSSIIISQELGTDLPLLILQLIVVVSQIAFFYYQGHKFIIPASRAMTLSIGLISLGLITIAIGANWNLTEYGGEFVIGLIVSGFMVGAGRGIGLLSLEISRTLLRGYEWYDGNRAVDEV